MSNKTKALVAAAVASMTVVVVPLATLAARGIDSVPVACSGTGSGGCS